jgi:hypothetical protein
VFFPQSEVFEVRLHVIRWIAKIMHMIRLDDMCWTSHRDDDMEEFTHSLRLIERHLAEMACAVRNAMVLKQAYNASFCLDEIPNNLIAPLKFRQIDRPTCSRNTGIVFGESRNYILLHVIGTLLNNMTKLPLGKFELPADEPTDAHNGRQHVHGRLKSLLSAVRHASVADSENDFSLGEERNMQYFEFKMGFLEATR